jgi:hypothetical protein
MRVHIFITSLILIIITLIVFFSEQNSQSEYLRCNTHVNSIVTLKDSKKIDINVTINAVINSNNDGQFKLVGSIKTDNDNYTLSRRLFITLKKSDFKKLTKAVIVREEQYPIDDTPDELWEKLILPETVGSEFYLEIKYLDENTILVKELSHPYFICSVEPN